MTALKNLGKTGRHSTRKPEVVSGKVYNAIMPETYVWSLVRSSLTFMCTPKPPKTHALLNLLAGMASYSGNTYINPARKRTPSFSFRIGDMRKLQITFCVHTNMMKSRAKLKLAQIKYCSGVFKHLPSVINGSQILDIGLQANISRKIIIV